MELILNKCSTCKIQKTYENFHKNKRMKLGISNRCKICDKQYQKQRNIKNKNKNKKYNKKNYEKNREKNIEYFKQRRKTVEHFLWRKKYEKENRKNINEYKKKWYHEDIKNKINCCMSSAILKSLKNKSDKKNKTHWEKIVGYNLEQLKQHLENQFYKDPKINWENYGSYWHIDHIIPKSLFCFISSLDEEFKKCWSLTNLQPLKAEENLKKGKRLK